MEQVCFGGRLKQPGLREGLRAGPCPVQQLGLFWGWIRLGILKQQVPNLDSNSPEEGGGVSTEAEEEQRQRHEQGQGQGRDKEHGQG